MKQFLPIIIFCLTACGSQELPEGSFEKLFTPEEWKSQASLNMDEFGITNRQKMLGDLVENHFSGKSRSALINMLGAPAKKMDPDGIGPKLSYPTGPERSYFRIDSEWLIISFDSNNILSYYNVRND